MATKRRAINGKINGTAAPNAASAEAKKAKADQLSLDPDTHHEYEFGGPFGVLSMMIIFPVLLYYLWICLVYFDGKLQTPSSPADIVPFVSRFYRLAKEHASPTVYAAKIYLGLMAFQLTLALILPGYQQEGMPVPSLGGKRLMYNCNGVQAFYVTMIAVAVAHYTNFFRLSALIDHFGPMMSVSFIASFVIAGVCYFGVVFFGKPIRMSGNFLYDYFMGAVLNPRIGSVDVKMYGYLFQTDSQLNNLRVAEVRVPWLLLFLISIGGCIKQHETFGYVSPNMAFMVMASGLFMNACAKGEELIPMTWDMTYEKFGWLLSFWNFAGVPFSYSYSMLYMATHDPAEYRFSTLGYVALYCTHLTAYYIFDTAMAQKSRFKMQMSGQKTVRWTFPQLPGSEVKNPTYIECANGGKLLTSGWWAYLRKPNYSADIIQVSTWALCSGFPNLVVYWYPFFFICMIFHRVGRDFARCERKYGKDWDRYCEVVPYRFVPYIY